MAMFENMRKDIIKIAEIFLFMVIFEWIFYQLVDILIADLK